MIATTAIFYYYCCYYVFFYCYCNLLKLLKLFQIPGFVTFEEESACWSLSQFPILLLWLKSLKKGRASFFSSEFWVTIRHGRVVQASGGWSNNLVQSEQQRMHMCCQRLVLLFLWPAIHYLVSDPHHNQDELPPEVIQMISYSHAQRSLPADPGAFQVKSQHQHLSPSSSNNSVPNCKVSNIRTGSIYKFCP